MLLRLKNVIILVLIDGLIEQMDRTSILGDAIDYMKELLEKIHTLREDDNVKEEIKDIKFVGNLKELKPNEALVRKPPKVQHFRLNHPYSIVNIVNKNCSLR